MNRTLVNQNTLYKLLEINRKLAENRSLDPLLEYAMEVALDLFGAEYGYLVLRRRNGSIDFRVCKDRQGNQLEVSEENISHSILKKVFDSGEPVLTVDAIVDPDFQVSESVQTLRLRSVMCVPLRSQNVQGAIYIENRSEKGLFQQKDLLPLEYFAVQATVAIENALKNDALEARIAQRTSELKQAITYLEEEIQTRKKVETELRKLSRAVEQSPNSILITDTEGRIEYTNPAFTFLTGYEFKEVAGKNPRFQKSGQTPPEVHSDLWNTISSGSVWRGEFVNQKKNGEVYLEFAVIAPIRNENGNITHYVAIKEDITARKHSEEELQRYATTDFLTGIYNRRHTFFLAERAFAQAKRYQRDLSVLMVDVDHFKKVNDLYGHAVGDQVLRGVAQSFVSHMRTTDILGRYGGEEFLVVMPETTLEQACHVADRLLNHLRTLSIQTETGEIPISISLGVAMMIPEHAPTFYRLIDQADQALYAAKQAGRNQFAVFTPAE